MSEVQALVLKMEANAAQLRAELKKTESGVATFQKKVDRTMAKYDKTLGTTNRRVQNVFKSWGKGFGELKTGMKDSLNSSASSMGLLGNAMTAMGPAGLGAAAAIGAVTVAVGALATKTRAALDFAEAIKSQAETAALDVEAFQELEYALGQFGITQDAVTDGLKELTLRADEFVQTGKGPAQEAFERLGYSQAELKKGLQDNDKLFEDIIGRMEDLDEAAQVRVADEIFGGTAGEQFVRALKEGKAGIIALRREAQEMGLVMDAQMIGRADEMRDKLQTMEKLISVQLNSALVDLGPALLWIVETFADMARWVGEVVDGFKDIENKSTQGVKKAVAEVDKQIQGLQEHIERLQTSLEQGGVFTFGIQQDIEEAEAKIDALLEKKKALEGELTSRGEETESSNVAGGGGSGGGTSETESQKKIRETKEALEEKIAALDRTARQQQIYEEIQRAGVTATSEEGKAIAELAGHLYDLTEAKKQAQELEVAEQKLELLEAEVEALAQGTEAWEAYQEAAKIDAEVSAFRDRLEALGLEAEQIEALTEKYEGLLEKKGELEKKNEDVNKTIEDQKKKEEELARSVEDGVNQVLNGQIKSWEDIGKVALDVIGQIINESGALEEALGGIFDGLGDGGGSSGGGGLGGVLGSLVGSIGEGIGSLFEFKDGGLIGGAPLPAFASGGRISGPGGPTSDSILARVSNGEYVVNAEATRRYLPLLEKINSGGGLPGFARGGQIGGGASGGAYLGATNVTIHVDARGAQKGVAEQIEEAFERKTPEIVEMSVGQVQDNYHRDAEYLPR